MSWLLFSPDQVISIHDAVLNPGELQGLARDKSLEGALARVDNRLAYGMIADVFELGAAYAEAIAQGHCFNDANKRTAFRVLHLCCHLNGARIPLDEQVIGPRIIALAQGALAAEDFADWLRAQAGEG